MSLHQLEPEHLYFERVDGDPDRPTLLLLHGLGGTGAVWDRVRNEIEWPGSIVAPDLRGHGSSPWTDHYSFGAMAADVTALLRPGSTAVAVGHSMGAIVSLALASGWFGIEVTHVMSVGIKVHWSDEDIAAIDKVAAKPPRTFESEAEAREWGAKLAGLFGVVDVDDPILDRSATAEGDRWRATLDPRAGLVGPPPLGDLHRVLGSTAVLHTLGASDPMATPAEAAEAGPPVEVFADAGHNAMVEQPMAVADALRRFMG